LGLASLSSHAATIFSQDFEAGLGANETSAGGFVLNTTGNAINGSTMMGHATAYSNSSNAYYQISNLALTGNNILLSFNYAAQFETLFDGFNVKVGNSVVTPTGSSAMQYQPGTMTNSFGNPIAGQRFFDSSSNTTGLAQFDLSAFTGSTVDILFQFGSDVSVVSSGINLDNVVIANEVSISNAVPEPTSFALLGLGLAGLTLSRRKRA
ncbi:PEP-CTERM sorting domain-containing protein, partial [Zoogloea ramigera]|uniref:PEP-CTERM sorting domain-containing protein n=1 Tax=Zoogloea ramigera TaxID=350 RepID=UPI0011432846